MANEFKHKDAGTTLTQAEDNATDRHAFDSQAVGDLLYASSTTVCSRLGIGDTDDLLTVVGGIPAWVAGRSGEGHIELLPLSYSAVNAGTWATWVDAESFFGWVFGNSTHDDLDEVDYQAYMAAGTYTFMILINKSPESGILDIDVNGVEVASFDLYTAGWSRNNRLTQAAIAIATSGLKTITFRVDGKHASSTNHYAIYAYACFWRTA